MRDTGWVEEVKTRQFQLPHRLAGYLKFLLTQKEQKSFSVSNLYGDKNPTMFSDFESAEWTLTFIGKLLRTCTCLFNQAIEFRTSICQVLQCAGLAQKTGSKSLPYIHH